MNNVKPRRFEGTVVSDGSATRGLAEPVTLTLIDRGDQFECQFEFFAGVPVPIVVTAPKSVQNKFEGSAEDPRGWDVAFTGVLDGDRITGTYNQPYDHGTFELREV